MIWEWDGYLCPECGRGAISARSRHQANIAWSRRLFFVLGEGPTEEIALYCKAGHQWLVYLTENPTEEK